MKTIGSIIRNARKELGENQNWLGLNVNVSTSTISRIETNDLIPDSKLIKNISYALCLTQEEVAEVTRMCNEAREAKIEAQVSNNFQVTNFPIEYIEEQLNDFHNIRYKGDLGIVEALNRPVNLLQSLRKSYPYEKKVSRLLGKYLILRLDIFIPTLPEQYIKQKTFSDLSMLEEVQESLKIDDPEEYDLARVLPASVLHIMGDTETALGYRRKMFNQVVASLPKAICVQDLSEQSSIAFINGEISLAEAVRRFPYDQEFALKVMYEEEFLPIERAIIYESLSKANDVLGLSDGSKFIEKAWKEFDGSNNPRLTYSNQKNSLFEQPKETTKAMIYRTEILGLMRKGTCSPEEIIAKVQAIVPFFEQTKHFRYWLQIIKGLKNHPAPQVNLFGEHLLDTLDEASWLH